MPPGGDELVDRLRRAAPGALAGLPVRVAYLFGSRAVGTARPDSDVDVAVLLDGEPADPQQVAFDVADALGTAAEVGDIEVTVLDGAPLRFAGRVLRQRIVLYSRDEPGRVEYESLTGRMADDVEFWAAEMDREILAAIADGRR